jgi:transcriptional regulator with XRE-family HTH domain
VARQDRQTQPGRADGADHPLRRLRLWRGLTQVELAGLAGLSCSYISMIERGQRTLPRFDHITAVTAALRVSPAELGPGTIPAPDEQAPSSAAPAPAFPAVRDEITVTRHAHLARMFMAYLARGDRRAAGIWLRRIARDPNVSLWLLLDQLTAPEIGLPGRVQASTGGSAVRLISAVELAEPTVEGARTG